MTDTEPVSAVALLSDHGQVCLVRRYQAENAYGAGKPILGNDICLPGYRLLGNLRRALMPARQAETSGTRQSGVPANLQVEECAEDAPYGGEFPGRDRAETLVEALICHRPGVFGPGEGRELAQAGRLRGDRDLMTQPPVPAGNRHHKDDRVRQHQVPRAGDDNDRAAACLFRSDDRIQVSQPDIAGPQRLAHSSSSPSPVVWSHSASSPA